MKFTALASLRLCCYLLGILSASAQAQRQEIDSIQGLAHTGRNDTMQLIYQLQLASRFSELDPDSAYHYASRALLLTDQLDLPLEKATALHEMGYAMNNLGNYPRALQHFLEGLRITEDPKSTERILSARFPPVDEFTQRNVSADHQRINKLSRTLQYTGILYGNSGNTDRSMQYILRAIDLALQTGNRYILAITYATKGRFQSQVKQYDAAISSLEKAYSYAREAGYTRYFGTFLLNLGRAYAGKGDHKTALGYYRDALDKSIQHGYYRGIVASRLLLADHHKKEGSLDSMLWQSRAALATAKTLNSPDLMVRCYRSLASYFLASKIADSVVRYQAMVISVGDSLASTKQVQQFQNIDFNEQQKAKDIEAAKKEYRNNIQRGILISVIGVAIAIALFIWRTSRQRQSMNAQLMRQKEDLEKAISDRKNTEKQLIHAEKMASLGELTAGIAHEIQNPLNFVNNFSELNVELIEELDSAIKNGQSADVIELMTSIRQNQEKTLEYGKRADGIVKSMLLHSRSSNSSSKEFVDLNLLAEEYLRLSFHGTRARDNSFNAGFELHGDPSSPKVWTSPQDVGRVLLNLCNNAFYAVSEKSRNSDSTFIPKVIVSTKWVDGMACVQVEDNGMGIPTSIRDKIFQPFFTTKPTGQGTGLGLSLSFDTITALGGEISMESEVGQFTRFQIRLPNP